MNFDGSDYQVVHQFDPNGGFSGSLLITSASNGGIFGVTFPLTRYPAKHLFLWQPEASFHTIHVFDFVTEGDNTSALITGPDGNIYGSNSQGGANTCATNGAGLLFSLVPTASGWQNATLGIFETPPDPKSQGYTMPLGGPVPIANGNLFGVTNKFYDVYATGKIGIVQPLHFKGGQTQIPAEDPPIIGPNDTIYAPGVSEGPGPYAYGSVYRFTFSKTP